MKSLEKIKKENIGKWIALKDKKVIIVNTDYHELHKTLKEKKVVGDIYVFYSPDPNEEKYEFML